MKVKNYRVVVEALSEEDGGGYLATVPDLPGCASDGPSQDEAIEGLSEAIDSWIAMARKLGRKIPAPHRAYA